MQLSQQAAFCSWVRGGYFWILHLLHQDLDQDFGTDLHSLDVFLFTLELVLEVLQVYLKLRKTSGDFHQAGLLIEPRLEASVFFCHLWKIQVVFCQYLLAVFTLAKIVTHLIFQGRDFAEDVLNVLFGFVCSGE